MNSLQSRGLGVVTITIMQSTQLKWIIWENARPMHRRVIPARSVEFMIGVMGISAEALGLLTLIYAGGK